MQLSYLVRGSLTHFLRFNLATHPISLVLLACLLIMLHTQRAHAASTPAVPVISPPSVNRMLSHLAPSSQRARYE